MKIRFEPLSTNVVVHERHINALVREMTPPAFDGSLVVTQYWRDSPVELTLRAEGNRPFSSSISTHEYYGPEGERRLREALMQLFEKALGEWDEKHPEPPRPEAGT
jgi:hypothetical protein